jgi:predicted RecB family nuclease
LQALSVVLDCRELVRESDDLTQVPELGRSRRDIMVSEIATVAELAEINPDGFITGSKTRFKGIGPDTLRKFQARALLLKTPDAKPYLTQPIRLPNAKRELHFDLEVDPLRDHVYLHGFVVRENGITQFQPFVAVQPTPESEKRAFADAMEFFRSSPNAVVYVYSAYERTIYNKLQRQYRNSPIRGPGRGCDQRRWDIKAKMTRKTSADTTTNATSISGRPVSFANHRLAAFI